MAGLVIEAVVGAILAALGLLGFRRLRGRPSHLADAARLARLQNDLDRSVAKVEITDADAKANEDVDAAVARDDPSYAEWLHNLGDHREDGTEG